MAFSLDPLKVGKGEGRCHGHLYLPSPVPSRVEFAPSMTPPPHSWAMALHQPPVSFGPAAITQPNPPCVRACVYAYLGLAPSIHLASFTGGFYFYFFYWCQVHHQWLSRTFSRTNQVDFTLHLGLDSYQFLAPGTMAVLYRLQAGRQLHACVFSSRVTCDRHARFGDAHLGK